MTIQNFAAIALAAFVITASSASQQEAQAATTIEEPRMGDHWTYVSRDEITNKIVSTFTHVVTDVTENDIGVRVTIPGKPDGFLTFDRAWNTKNDGTWRFTPNNGTGIKEPLTIGKAWTVAATGTTGAGANWSRSGSVKVVGQESITTKAGTFDTFEIESTFEDRDNNDATKKLQAVQRMWYAPMVNHWIKQTLEVRMGGTLLQKTSVELIDYGRRD